MDASLVTELRELLSAGGPWMLVVGTLASVGGAVYKGFLIPKQTHDGIVQSYERQITSLTAAREAADGRADVLLRQQQRLMEVTYLVKDAAQRLGEAADDATT